MDIKLDVNKLVDKLANAERTIGEQGKTIANYETVIRGIREELADAKQGLKEQEEVIKGWKKECYDLQESVNFWYAKALDLGYIYIPEADTNKEGIEFGA